MYCKMERTPQEIWIKILESISKTMHLIMWSAKWCPFCEGNWWPFCVGLYLLNASKYINPFDVSLVGHSDVVRVLQTTTSLSTYHQALMDCAESTARQDYHKVSNIRSTKCQNLDVVGAALTGDAATTSEWSTTQLPTKVHLILETWR